MKRNTYFPIRQADQIVWLANFSSKLAAYLAALGLTAGQGTAAVADCKWLIYVLESWLPAARAWALACTDAATEAQLGDGSAAMALPVFTAPDLPNGVVPVPPGALNRIFALVGQIKGSGKCTEAIGTDLGIFGAEHIAPDFATLQPTVSATTSGNHVIVKWGWGGNVAYLDSCEIQVDRGDGKGFGLLTVDTTPNYNDTQTFPTARTVWTYRAIYRVGDEQVGLWSQSVTVAVPA